MARQSAPRGTEPHTPAGAPDKGLKGGCAMPEDNVFQRITQEYYQLTASEKKLANYVVANGQRTQSMSISELAGECGVAEATITRFCRRMGYQGYSAFTWPSPPPPSPVPPTRISSPARSTPMTPCPFCAASWPGRRSTPSLRPRPSSSPSGSRRQRTCCCRRTG